jgi:hypothetical protein
LARTRNITEIKNWAFRANRHAKATFGSTRDAWYTVKARAISVLVELGAAAPNGTEYLFDDLLISVSFVNGGDLHAILSRLDEGARAILEQQHGVVIGARSPRGVERW